MSRCYSYNWYNNNTHDGCITSLSTHHKLVYPRVQTGSAGVPWRLILGTPVPRDEPAAAIPAESVVLSGFDDPPAGHLEQPLPHPGEGGRRLNN